MGASLELPESHLSGLAIVIFIVGLNLELPGDGVLLREQVFGATVDDLIAFWGFHDLEVVVATEVVFEGFAGLEGKGQFDVFPDSAYPLELGESSLLGLFLSQSLGLSFSFGLGSFLGLGFYQGLDSSGLPSPGPFPLGLLPVTEDSLLGQDVATSLALEADSLVLPGGVSARASTAGAGFCSFDPGLTVLFELYWGGHP